MFHKTRFKSGSGSTTYEKTNQKWDTEKMAKAIKPVTIFVVFFLVISGIVVSLLTEILLVINFILLFVFFLVISGIVVSMVK